MNMTRRNFLAIAGGATGYLSSSIAQAAAPRAETSYKMVAMVLGTNIVRKELGLPEAECLAADARYSLTQSA